MTNAVVAGEVVVGEVLLAEEAELTWENGDVTIEDTGDYLGCLDQAVKVDGVDKPLPFAIEYAIYKDGYWYVYKLDRRYADVTSK